MGIHELEAAIADHRPDAIKKTEYHPRYHDVLRRLINGGASDMVEAASKMKGLPGDLRCLANTRLTALNEHSRRAFGAPRAYVHHKRASTIPAVLRHL